MTDIAAPATEAAFLPLSPLVQRATQAALLRHALTGPPAIVFLEGEAGIGKTRLVGDVLAALRAADPAARAFTGRCHRQQNPFPLLPVVDAVRTAETALRGKRLSPVAGALRSLLPELTHVLPTSPEPAEDGEANRHHVFRGLVEVLTAIGPGVVVLEDLHWADIGTLEFLHFVVTQPGPLPHLVLTYRRDDLAPGSTLRSLSSRIPAGTMQVRIELPALDSAGVAELVEGMLTSEVSADFASFLHQRTNGVPFAVEEVLRLLTDRRDLVRLNGRWARHALSKLEVPLAIRDSIGERISRLPAAARDVVEAVAVLGPDATVPAISAVTAIDAGAPLREALEMANRSALIRDGVAGVMEFRHDLAKEAAYDGIDPAHRRELHARAGQALVARPETGAAQLALHLRESGDPGWMAHAERAADHALALADSMSAHEMLRDILTSGGLTRPDRLRIAAKLGDAALLAQLPVEATRLIREVLDEGGHTAAERGELQFVLALLLFTAGDVTQAFERLRLCTQECPPDAVTTARAMSVLSFPMVEATPVEEHLGWLDRAMKAAQNLSDPIARFAVEGNAATVRLGLGLIDPGVAASEVPVVPAAAPVLLHQSRVRHNLAEMCCYIGHYDAARAFLVEAAELDGRLGIEINDDVSAQRVFLDFLTGHWPRIVDRSETLERSLHRVPQARAVATLSRVLVTGRTGRGPAVPAELATLVDQALACGSIPVFLIASAARADALLEGGLVLDSVAVAARAVTVVQQKGLWVWSGELLIAAVRALVAADDLTGARALVREAGVGLRGRLAPVAAAGLETARGMTAQKPDARRRHLMRASAAWASLGRRYEVAATTELLGHLLDDLGDAPGAAQTWQQAADAFAAIGATRDVGRVTRALRERGMPVRVRRPGRVGDELSEREREVVQLVATGQTNREIAEQLFLSPRTVEHHVERAMRKLGVQSRLQLVAAVERPGWVGTPPK